MLVWVNSWQDCPTTQPANIAYCRHLAIALVWVLAQLTLSTALRGAATTQHSPHVLSQKSVHRVDHQVSTNHNPSDHRFSLLLRDAAIVS
jgi:hypothetical protein